MLVINFSVAFIFFRFSCLWIPGRCHEFDSEYFSFLPMRVHHSINFLLHIDLESLLKRRNQLVFNVLPLPSTVFLPRERCDKNLTEIREKEDLFG